MLFGLSSIWISRSFFFVDRFVFFSLGLSLCLWFLLDKVRNSFVRSSSIFRMFFLSPSLFAIVCLAIIFEGIQPFLSNGFGSFASLYLFIFLALYHPYGRMYVKLFLLVFSTAVSNCAILVCIAPACRSALHKKANFCLEVSYTFDIFWLILIYFLFLFILFSCLWIISFLMPHLLCHRRFSHCLWKYIYIYIYVCVCFMELILSSEVWHMHPTWNYNLFQALQRISSTVPFSKYKLNFHLCISLYFPNRSIEHLCKVTKDVHRVFLPRIFISVIHSHLFWQLFDDILLFVSVDWQNSYI